MTEQKHRLDEPDEFDGTHRVTATEPCWTEQEHEPDDDGVPEPVGQFRTGDIIDGYFEESVYECTCGVELTDWSEVELHFAIVTD